MTQALMAEAAQKLRQAGETVEDDTLTSAICRDIARAIGEKRRRGQTMVNYLLAYLAMPDEIEPEPDPFIPQKATAPDWGHRSPYRPPAHFRDDEINAMPRPIAMSGVGNGGDSGHGRGR